MIIITQNEKITPKKITKHKSLTLTKKIVVYRKDLFELPKGAKGKEFVKGMTRNNKRLIRLLMMGDAD